MGSAPQPGSDSALSDSGSASDGGSGAVCGNAVLEAGEQCDDGINDGSYGGCLPGCSGPGPSCEDGLINDPEQCDGSDTGGATCNGAVTCDAACMLDWSGCDNYSLEFDAVSSYVGIGQFALTSSTLTWEAWVKVRAYFDYGKIIDFGASSSGTRFTVQTVDSGLSCELDGDIGGVVFYTTAETDTWHHVACTWTAGASLQIYVDGLLRDTDTSVLATDMTISTTDAHIIGRRITPTNYFDGFIDEVRIWDVVRSSMEIGGSMNGRLLGNEPSLVGYWRFDEGTGQTTVDLSSGGNDGQRGAAPVADASDPAWSTDTPW